MPFSEDEYQQTMESPAVETTRLPNYADDARSYVPDVSAPIVQAQPQQAKGGNMKSLLVGLAGGAVSALAVSLALNAAGIGGAAQTKVIQTTESAAGQTISINATTEDATVAKAVAAKALPSVVSVYVSSSVGAGLGSGAILDTDGNIITNYHVVEGAESISVTIGGKSYDATLVGTDPSSDLAVVKAELNGDAVTPIEVGDSDALVVGDWVMTIGSPFGLDQSVSAGIVSSLSRNQLMQSAAGNTLYTNLIQTDASINPGNSGGALVNSEGKLVGISTLFSSDTQSFAGIGFAIPGNYAIDVANKIIAGEQVTHAYIGLSMQTVNAQNAQQYHLSVNQGAYVAEVAEGGPAAAAGLQEGDIITRLGGEEITSADGMILAVRGHKIGETVDITFMRGTEEMTAQVTFGDDAELQKLQKEQLEQQQQQMQQDESYGLIGGPEDQYDQYGYPDYQNDVTYEDILEYLFNNNHGGSYRVQ
ncbi:MAG: trypsin-like peptidase domain-containing protein [Atopobiaceae bacterium]|nr:trypsin-like peptidase domain-containing protein [Atopobiaceae bacterium]